MPPPSKCKSCMDAISCRHVLYGMVLLGFMFNYMLRVNLTIAIVSMVKPANVTTIDYLEANSTHLLYSNSTTIEDDGQVKYEWDSYLQNIILGAFFWGYICTELPGGRLAEVVGARRVFGYSMLMASIVTIATPFACNLHYIAVIVLRVILGFMLGATWPAIPPMIAKWVPPMERSKFMANMMASSLGAAITLPVCGFLIESYGWESAFYVTGVVGVIWSVAWFLLIHDSPAQHPRITEAERRFIEDSIGNTSSKIVHSVPWRQLLSSAPVWAIVITHGCSVYGYFTVVNQLPTYTKNILNYNIKENGLLSSLPYLGKYVSAIACSALADHLRKTEKLTTTATRKIFTGIAVMGPGFLMLLQVFFGYDRVFSIVIFTVALTINGAVTAGYFSNGLDIAPNFSGTIFGLANTLSSLGGFLSSLMVGTLTKDNPKDYSQWQTVFWILTAVYIGGGLVYIVLGTGELQSWNSPATAIPTEEEAKPEMNERIPLKNGSKA